MEVTAEALIALERRVAKLEAQVTEALKITEYIHPMTRKAMVEHAPEMTQEEMDRVVTKYWAIGQQYANSKEYALRRNEVLDSSSVAKAARELFWLKRAKVIEYLKPMRVYTII